MANTSFVWVEDGAALRKVAYERAAWKEYDIRLDGVTYHHVSEKDGVWVYRRLA